MHGVCSSEIKKAMTSTLSADLRSHAWGQELGHSKPLAGSLAGSLLQHYQLNAGNGNEKGDCGNLNASNAPFTSALLHMVFGALSKGRVRKL